MRLKTLCIALAAVVSSSHIADAEDKIRIGLIGSASGSCSSGYDAARLGAEQAAARINETGQLLSKQVELFAIDSQCSPEGTTTSATVAIHQKSVDFLIFTQNRINPQTLATFAAKLPVPSLAVPSGIGSGNAFGMEGPRPMNSGALLQFAKKYYRDGVVAIITTKSALNNTGRQIIQDLESTHGFGGEIRLFLDAKRPANILSQLPSDKRTFALVDVVDNYHSWVQQLSTNTRNLTAAPISDGVDDVYWARMAFSAVEIAAQAIEDAGTTDTEAVRASLGSQTFYTLMGQYSPATENIVHSLTKDTEPESFDYVYWPPGSQGSSYWHKRDELPPAPYWPNRPSWLASGFALTR